MNWIIPFSAFILSVFLGFSASAIDEGGGGSGGGSTGGGSTGGGSTGGGAGGGESGSGSGGGKPARHASASAARLDFTPLDQARGAVQEKRFAVALRRLQRIVKNEPTNADAWNLLGFTYRMLGDLEQSGSAYAQVLAIDPDHTGALEYQGELFITQGNIAAAKANLARLKLLCGSCEAEEDLEQALKTVGA